MKKYYQAALALTAALSLVALLFYRHEYNKLRFVLQVFNYFGTPVYKSNNTCTIQFEDQLSSWQRLSHDLYIYSAYNYHNGEIISIAFGKNTQKFDFSCDILFSDEMKPVTGKFTYEKIDNKNIDSISTDYDRQFSGYLLKCKYDKYIINKTIVGIQFLSLQKNHYDHNSFPIIQVFTRNNDNNIDRTNNVICISPPMTRLMKYVDMISFLSHHDYIGWNSFIVYDYGISPVFNNGMKKMTKLLNNKENFTYTTVPWNFPYSKVSSEVMKNIVEIDCLYKNYNRANLAITLAWNEYVNLKYHTSIENLIFDIGKVTGKAADKFQTNIQVYCVDENNPDLLNSSILTVLSTTLVLSNNHQNQSQNIYKLDNILNSYIIEQNIDDLVFINQYQKCNAIYSNNKMGKNGELRFVENLPNSRIFQYYITSKLFNY